MASKISGVGVHTIRAWEKRYKALEPIRDSSGHRVYNKTDVEKLILLSELCFVGYAISKVAKFSIPELKELLKSLGKVTEEVPSEGFNLIKDQPTVQASDSIGILKFALVNLKMDIINVELGKLKLAIDPKDFALEIVLPLYQQIQEMKSNGHIPLQQYHILVQIIKFHAGHYIYHQSAIKEHSNFNLFIGGIEHHSDELSYLMTALIASHYKIQLTYFDLSRSIDELAEVANLLKPASLFMSFQNTDSSTAFSLLEKFQNKLSYEVEILLADNLKIANERVNLKKLKAFKSFQEIDEYLATKKSI